MSFVEQDDVIALGEQILVALWDLIGVTVPTPVPRITFAESMARYGNDKPDLRFGLELVELTEFFVDTPFRVFQAPYVGAVVQPGGGSTPRRGFDAWQEWAKQRGAKGLAYVTVGEDGKLGGPVAKNLSERAGGPGRAVGAGPGTPSSSRPARRARPRPARCCSPRDRPTGRPHRRERLEVRLGRRRPAVQAHGRGRRRRGGRRRLDGRAPRVHVSDARVDRHVRAGPGRGAGVRVRHRLQRQRDRRRVHPYPPPRRAGARVRHHGHRPGRGSGEVRLPPRRVPVRRAAARRDRVRLGPHPRAADRLGVDPRRDRVPEVGRWLRPADGRAGARSHRSSAARPAWTSSPRLLRPRERDILAGLPPRWRTDRLLCGDRSRWSDVAASGDDDGILLVLRALGRSGVTLLGRGDGAVVDRLVEDASGRLEHVRWISVPRTSRPSTTTSTRCSSRRSRRGTGSRRTRSLRRSWGKTGCAGSTRYGTPRRSGPAWPRRTPARRPIPRKRARSAGGASRDAASSSVSSASPDGTGSVPDPPGTCTAWACGPPRAGAASGRR